jgi:hypothetical protein
MAKAPVKPPAKAANKETALPAKKGMKAQSMVLCLILAALAVKLMPTTLVVVIGMVPTAVAYFVDSSREKSLGPVVLWLNFSGVLPALLKLWQQGHTMSNALDIIMQPIMLAMMLFPAAIGWLLYSFVPYLVVGFVRKKAESRIKSLEKYQQDLVDQWGSEVSGVHPKTESSQEHASLTA